MSSFTNGLLAQLVALPLVVSIRSGGGRTIKLRTNQMPIVTYEDERHPSSSQRITFSPVTSIENVPCAPTAVTVAPDMVSCIRLDHMALWDMAQTKQTELRKAADAQLDSLLLSDSSVTLEFEDSTLGDGLYSKRPPLDLDLDGDCDLDLTDPSNVDSALVGGNPPTTTVNAISIAATELNRR